MLIILNSCDSGCIEAYDNGNLQVSEPTDIYPVDPTLIASNQVSSNVSIDGSNLGAISQEYQLLPGTTNASAFAHLWQPINYKNKQGNLKPIIAYSNMNVVINVSGSVLLNGSQAVVTVSAKHDKLTDQQGHNEYYIPTVVAPITIAGGSDIQFTILNSSAPPAPPDCNNDSTITNSPLPNCMQNHIPSLNGVNLTNGLGVFAVIENLSGEGVYGDPSTWACNNGLGGINAGGHGTFGANGSGCVDFTIPPATSSNNAGYGYTYLVGNPIRISDNECTPSTTTENECIGFKYDSATTVRDDWTDYDAGHSTAAGTAVISNIGRRKRADDRNRYLFYGIDIKNKDLLDIAHVDHLFGPSTVSIEKEDGTPFETDGVKEAYAGLAFFGKEMHNAGSYGWDPTNFMTILRIHNPFVWNPDFSMCTHRRDIKGWASSGDAVLANFNHAIGPLSHTYFGKTLNCPDIDAKYNIRATGAKYGGFVYSQLTKTDVWWGNKTGAFPLVTECRASYINTFDIDTDIPKDSVRSATNNLNCSSTDGHNNTVFCPIAPSNRPLKAVHNLQYISAANLVSVSKYINAPKTRSGRSGVSSYADQKYVQRQYCQVTLNVNGTSTAVNIDRANEWSIIGYKFNKGSDFSINVDGQYSNKYAFQGAIMAWPGLSGTTLTCYSPSYQPKTPDIFSDLGRKNCRASTAYAVKQIPFVSCFSDYKTGCTHPRSSASDCKTVATYTSGTTTQTTQVGMCQKLVGGVTSNAANGVQKYSRTTLPNLDKLVDADYSAFNVFENVYLNNCGVCVLKNLTGNGAYLQLDSTDDNNFSFIKNPGILTSADCYSNADYQWLTSYYDTSRNKVVQYVFTQNALSNYCKDDPSKVVSGSGSSKWLRSLTALTAHARYDNKTEYGYIAGASGSGMSTSTYRVPDDMDGSSVSIGIAGNNKIIEMMYTAASAAFNINNYYQVFIQSGKSTTANDTPPGKYLFFYIQEFDTDPTTGQYTTNPKPSKHPDVIFLNKTPNQMFEMMTDSISFPMYNFIEQDGITNGIPNGSAIIIPGVTGKLWATVLDLTIPISAADPDYNGYSKDRDGLAIIYKQSVPLGSDPGVSTSYDNIISNNTGAYTLNVRAEKPESRISVLGNTVIAWIITQIQTIFYGEPTTPLCKTIYTPNTKPITNTQPYRSVTNIQGYTPQYCATDNTMITTEIIPTAMASAQPQSVSSYSCSKSGSSYSCQLKINGSAVTNTLVPMILMRYGNCASGGSSNSQICLVYSFNQSNNDLMSCLRTDYSNTSCWTDTNSTQTIAGPYTYVSNNDMLPGNIMPKCDTGKAYKSYSNCSIVNNKKLCDVNRDCFPNQGTTYTQNQIEVPFSVSQADDGGNDPANDSILSVTGCTSVSNADVSTAYCQLDPIDPGYKKCILGTSSIATCHTCIRPIISTIPLNLLNAPNIAHNCTATTNNYFYCDTAVTNACGGASQPDITFPSGGDSVTICDSSSINISAIIAHNNATLASCNNFTPAQSVATVATTAGTFSNAIRSYIVQFVNSLPVNSENLNYYSFIVTNQNPPYKLTIAADDSARVSLNGGAFLETYCGYQLFDLVGCHDGGLPKTYDNLSLLTGINLVKLNYVDWGGFNGYMVKIEDANGTTVFSSTSANNNVIGAGFFTGICPEPSCTTNCYCGSACQTALGGQNLQQGYNALLAQNNNLSSLTSVPSDRVATPLISSPLPLSKCTVKRQCNYQPFTPTTPVSFTAPAKLVKSDAYTVTYQCTNDFNWQNGLIYQIVTMFTTNLGLIACFYISVILYITLRGLAIFLGTETINVRDLSKQLVQLSLVLMFFSPNSWNYYQTFIISFYVHFTQGLDTMIAGIVMPNITQNGTNLFGPVDAVLDMTLLNENNWKRASALLFSTWYGWIIFAIYVGSIFTYIVIAFRALSMYLSTIVMSSLFFCLGPIFFILLLFEETKPFFNVWKNQIISMIASQAYLFATLAIFSYLYLGVIKGLLYFKICFKSIISIPIADITIIGWYKIASNTLPEAILYQIGTNSALLQSYDNNMPSFAVVILLAFLMALFEKFIQSPLVGGKGGMEIADAAAPLFNSASGLVKGATVGLVMAPIAGAEKALTKIPGIGGLISRFGVSDQLTKIAGGQPVSAAELSKTKKDPRGIISNKQAIKIGQNRANKSPGIQKYLNDTPPAQPNPSRTATPNATPPITSNAPLGGSITPPPPPAPPATPTVGTAPVSNPVTENPVANPTTETQSRALNINNNEIESTKL